VPFTRQARWLLSVGFRAAGWVVIVALAGVLLSLTAFVAAQRAYDWEAVIVTGGSMEPTIRLGAVAVVEPVEADNLDLGQIVTFEDPLSQGRLVTHRIVGFTEDGDLLTRGDANTENDAAPVPRGSVRSRVLFSIPYLGYLAQGSRSVGLLGAVLLGLGCLSLVLTHLPVPLPARFSRNRAAASLPAVAIASQLVPAPAGPPATSAFAHTLPGSPSARPPSSPLVSVPPPRTLGGSRPARQSVRSQRPAANYLWLIGAVVLGVVGVILLFVKSPGPGTGASGGQPRPTSSPARRAPTRRSTP
jgi:signal peptidase